MSKAKSSFVRGDDGAGRARKHNCVLQRYLSGFTRNHDKNSQLYVVDSAVAHAFVTTPVSVAAEREFSPIEIDTDGPASIQLSYGQFELELASAVTRINSKGDFSSDADRALILKLIAQLAMLSPDCMEGARRYNGETTGSLSEFAIANREGWESQKQTVAQPGTKGVVDLTREKLRTLGGRNDETIAALTTEHHEQDLLAMTTIYNLLHRRSWIVARATSSSGGFITSDRPVTLSWDDVEREAGPDVPGLGLQGTSVFFPLTKDLVMRGRFDGRVGTLELPITTVAGINSRTIFYADHQIYAETDRFRFLDEHLLMRYGQELLPALQRS
ncbi:hypothetical protein LMG28140_01687 [Paraburkholderia metrosideri]|uniref:DUF4238 domain-containing protein n=2 Tax=Paraburkholderia metrosideri TaxID=580937 RepID=A0ABM8NH46_9BURK|nr:hypothetical protein LMG28140_01687 [Paraburkholderia metrosideri]